MPDETKESELSAAVEDDVETETADDGGEVLDADVSVYELTDDDELTEEEAPQAPVLPRMPPPPPTPALAHVGASQLPPSPIETIEAIAEAVNRLRSEVSTTTNRARRARLLNEAAEIQERAGDEAGAARDYLGSYNSDTTFREPLESLVRLLERRRSLTNIGKLVEALAATSATPEERARALTQRAIFSEDAQKDLEGARGAAREATETGADATDIGAAWLALEMVAAKLGDPAQREEALAGRANIATDPTWRALLSADLAEIAVKDGEIERALGLLVRARGEGGSAAFHVATLTDRLTRHEPGIAGSDEARARHEARADALAAQADMVRKALADDAAGDAFGVPRYCRNFETIVDLSMRAADARRLAGDIPSAGTILDAALADLAAAMETDDDAPTTAGLSGRDSFVTMERLLLAARLRMAELAGDTERAAELAERRAVGETDGGIAASLAMRVAENAASKGDIANALVALSRATQHDPKSAPARALRIDMLGDGDATELAQELEELAQELESNEAKGRALVLAAYIWASRTQEATRASAALERAQAIGVPKATIAHLSRSLASLRSNVGWYEHATEVLIEHAQSGAEDAPSAAELPLLWIELARLRLARGDEAGAAEATATVRTLPQGQWLGRVLDGLTASHVDAARARTAIEELASDASDPTLSRSLRVVCALRARAAGDERTAIRHLEALAQEDPADPLVAAYLGDLLRLAGDRAAAGQLAGSAAERIDAEGSEPTRAAARYLEAGLESWRRDDRASALTRFRAAETCAPDAALAAVRWGARAMHVDSVEGRRLALEVAGDDASIALERFALEATLGDPDEATQALAAVEASSSESLRLAAALARLSWPGAQSDVEAVSSSLDALAVISERTKLATVAERHRIAREAAGTDATETADAAHAWLDAGGGFPAALEWLASAMAAGDGPAELAARRALAHLASDESRESLEASAALFSAMLSPDEPHPFVQGSSHAARLANLELSPPGCDPRRRAEALTQLNGALGEECEDDAVGLAAWSTFASGSTTAALELFRRAVEKRPDDLHAWEGFRACAEELGYRDAQAEACEQIGARCSSAERGAEFWERAALTWIDLGDSFESRIEPALDASFARDATRAVAFDRLFRRVRERKDHEKILALIERRLEVTDDSKEIAKLYWEQARALREKGDPEGALEALEHVTTFDEDHIGALALTGEIFIRAGRFEEAAEKLARLSRTGAAPPKNRVTAGVAAVDLYENKLQRHDLALHVLLALHAAGLSTLPVRERLARAAARTGSWTDATKILEELMLERPEREGRIEAARFAMAIHVNRLQMPSAALPAATKLLEEAPGDAEGLDLVLSLDPSLPERRPLLERGRDAVVMSVHDHPTELAVHERLRRIADAVGDRVLEQAALSCTIALGGPDLTRTSALATQIAAKPRLPQVAFGDAMFRQILASGDDGPLADLFTLLGTTLGEALGPTRDGLRVGRKDRIDPKAGTALRAEIAQWAGAFGIGTFDLYVGGTNPNGVQGIAGDPPAIVVGSAVNAPLSAGARAQLARELASLVRGTTMLRSRDDTTALAVAIAACNLAKVRVEPVPVPGLADIERQVGKALSRKVRAAIEPVCNAWVASRQDARKWATRARMTQARFATLACGDVSFVLAELFGEPLERVPARALEDVRAHELLRFTLSLPYFEVRRSLGLEGDR